MPEAVFIVLAMQWIFPFSLKTPNILCEVGLFQNFASGQLILFLLSIICENFFDARAILGGPNKSVDMWSSTFFTWSLRAHVQFTSLYSVISAIHLADAIYYSFSTVLKMKHPIFQHNFSWAICSILLQILSCILPFLTRAKTNGLPISLSYRKHEPRHIENWNGKHLPPI